MGSTVNVTFLLYGAYSLLFFGKRRIIGGEVTPKGRKLVFPRSDDPQHTWIN